jgi:HTH-type transcriptional regulator / antitoxin HigA
MVMHKEENMYGFGTILKSYLKQSEISQTDFADRIGISVKHLNNLINGKAKFTDEIILAISLVTDIDPSLIIFAENRKRVSEYLNSTFKDTKSIKKYLNSFDIKTIENNKWYSIRSTDELDICAIDLLKYLGISSFNELDNYLNKKLFFKKNDDSDPHKILVWLRHCELESIKQVVNDYSGKKLNELINELKNESNNLFDINRLTKIFNKYGIYFYVEDALPKMKLRGLMEVRNNHPAIFLTKYYKEKSSFYFTLYHELGHVKTDYNKAKSKIITDDLDESDEQSMDNFALNLMIPNELWNNITNNLDDIKKISQENSVPLSFIYSRLAKEKYIKFNDPEYLKSKEFI